MTSNEVREKFLKYFESKGHKIMPSSSLIPDDPSVLFTTAGMQQWKPYYTNPDDAPAKNIVTVQKCIRTSDIDEVGDDTHLTFFEMLGNFSFGGYWKKEAIEYAHEFLTKELGQKIDYVTVFKGENGIPADNESKEIWKNLGITDIREEGMESVFWGPTGEEGPCGPTTEIYINGVEIWNIVFNEYYKSKDGVYTPTDTKGIDTGMGLERLLVQVQKKNNVYETDLFEPIMTEISNITSLDTEEKIKNARILADHAKTARFMILDGTLPSNTDRGYVLRRIIRRAILYTKRLGIDTIGFALGEIISNIYESIYPEFKTHSQKIGEVLKDEREKFNKTLELGLKEFEKGTDPFILATTYGFPIELTEELAKEKGQNIDRADFETKMKEHQKLSQTSSAGMFKGGLANHDPETIRLHTAHHLLLSALQNVLGNSVKQRGSNIDEKRLRIDFSFDRKLTDEEKKKVEEIVNDWIKRDLKVEHKEMKKEEAEKIGAQMEFGAKYGDVVSIYLIVDENGNPVSKEFCGGPHVTHTGELNNFKILKEEASSQGVRRIKAVLE